MGRLAEIHALQADAADQPPPIGHNGAPEPTPFELVSNAIDGLSMEGKNWLDGGVVATQVEADSIALLMDSFRRASKEADEARKAEAKPFDDGKAEVQARYNPLLKRAATAIDGCKAALSPWLQKLEDEKRAEAQAAQQAAQAAQAAAAEAMAAAAPTDLAARETAESLVTDAKRATTKANVAARARAQAAGGSRSTTLRTYWTAKIADGVTVARHYWADNRPACEAFFLSLAEADVRAGKRQIPGVTVTEDRRVV
jgi:hypothetical protein